MSNVPQCQGHTILALDYHQIYCFISLIAQTLILKIHSEQIITVIIFTVSFCLTWPERTGFEAKVRRSSSRRFKHFSWHTMFQLKVLYLKKKIIFVNQTLLNMHFLSKVHAPDAYAYGQVNLCFILLHICQSYLLKVLSSCADVYQC